MTEQPPRDEPEHDGRPAFARAYPHTKDIDELIFYFLSGDYRKVRELAPRMTERAGDEREKQAIADLRRRIEADPMALYLLGLTLALLVFVTVWFYAHAH
jgi:hypothetical protein